MVSLSVIAQSQDGCTNELQNTDGITQQTKPDGGMQWKATHHKHNKQLHMADALVTVASNTSCICGWGSVDVILYPEQILCFLFHVY